MQVLAHHTVGFLGPAGTFSEQAALTQVDLAQARLVPCGSFAEILFAVAEGDLDVGLVAIENAIEGTVNVTLDTLAFDVDVLIQREIVLELRMNLLTQPGAELNGITRVASYPHAYSQCRSWLRQHLGSIELVQSSSTADAARLVAESNDPHLAAVGNARAAEVYGLEIAANEIEDHVENSTRFAVVAREGIPAPTGHDKTSLVIFQRADEPGSLLGILQEFAARQINLSLLLSRPTRTTLGDYCFVVDLEGHISNEVVADCLTHLKAFQADVKFLGSYPAGGAARHAAREQFDASMSEASNWITRLRSQISTE